jgi:hypothetical protein
MHPHQYGNIGDFIFSAMGYFTDDYTYGQIDKDAIQRAHVDQIYMETEQLLNQASTDPIAAQTITQARNKLSEADSAYNAMKYADALQSVLAAHQLALQIGTVAGPIIILAFGVVIGVVLGLVIAVIIMKRRREH